MTGKPTLPLKDEYVGSIRRDNAGREKHWADPNLNVSTLEKPKKQVRSSKGQKPLFEEVPIDHLEKKMKRARQ